MPAIASVPIGAGQPFTPTVDGAIGKAGAGSFRSC